MHCILIGELFWIWSFFFFVLFPTSRYGVEFDHYGRRMLRIAYPCGGFGTLCSDGIKTTALGDLRILICVMGKSHTSRVVQVVRGDHFRLIAMLRIFHFQRYIRGINPALIVFRDNMGVVRCLLGPSTSSISALTLSSWRESRPVLAGIQSILTGIQAF